MIICMTMVASKLLLSILWTKYETLRWENGSKAGRLTWKMAGRQIIRPRKELDPQSLHIGRMDLVIDGFFVWPRAPLWQDCMRAWHNLRCGVSILQNEGRSGSAAQRWPQASWDGCGGLDFEQESTDHRPISRFSVKPRNAGDCMMNESWQEPGGAEISCAEPG